MIARRIHILIDRFRYAIVVKTVLSRVERGETEDHVDAREDQEQDGAPAAGQ